ncbi:type II toxin-antitoxin system VapC family toxin [Sphaerospermopsis aphanizomenoides BCCUSP55]|uniref:type II toxin-antitoxin system VapC family toxin n=1 Tax=Sphaerospermopsis aphanizomenoides TaxID=459663 RepID=UPI001902D64C|nr:type II toxin-antitoxin system VapC family toxin [Sphaerospermopsis aphanizomenoides]MBK1989820.1 type II toxin-antitoxin system VapC family toxin [Sphaerospermopsis aphanizomenoides BCCUSP55]
MSFRFLLDTNIISEINKKIPNKLVVEKMNKYQSEVSTALVVIHELLFGYLRLPPDAGRRRFLADYIQEIPAKMPVFDYDLNAAKWHAQERARLAKIGKTPAFIDGQIASIAFCNDLILVTNNVADFQDFEDLMIENWFI